MKIIWANLVNVTIVTNIDNNLNTLLNTTLHKSFIQHVHMSTNEFDEKFQHGSATYGA